MSIQPSPRPLAGFRIVDLSRVLAGPWATQLLADLGAEVIKVERPVRGDDSRSFGPPFLPAEDGEWTGASAMFLAANRGKRSLTLDLGREEGRAVLRDLVATADVLVENFKVGTLARMGLDAQALRAINPGLIVCSITGYGQTGPYADRGGYDPVIQGLCGLMSVTGNPPEMPGGGPMKTGPSLVDIITGLYAVIAIQAALIERGKDGPGVDLDLSLMDCGVAVMAQQAMHYALTGVPPRPIGTGANGGVPGGGYVCADGHIMIAPGNDAGYARMCGAIGRSDLATDPRFRTNRDRLAHRAELLGLLEPIFASWTVADLYAALLAADVPSGPVNDLAQVEADPQVAARGLFAGMAGQDGQTVPQVASPLVYGGSRAMADMPPPRLGQDNDALLAELGRDADARDALRAANIV